MQKGRYIHQLPYSTRLCARRQHPNSHHLHIKSKTDYGDHAPLLAHSTLKTKAQQAEDSMEEGRFNKNNLTCAPLLIPTHMTITPIVLIVLGPTKTLVSKNHKSSH